MNERDNIIALAIARQIAQFQGQIFYKLSDKQRASLLTLAHSIMATQERLRNARHVAGE